MKGLGRDNKGNCILGEGRDDTGTTKESVYLRTGGDETETRKTIIGDTWGVKDTGEGVVRPCKQDTCITGTSPVDNIHDRLFLLHQVCS